MSDRRLRHFGFPRQPSCRLANDRDYGVLEDELSFVLFGNEFLIGPPMRGAEQIFELCRTTGEGRILGIAGREKVGDLGETLRLFGQ